MHYQLLMQGEEPKHDQVRLLRHIYGNRLFSCAVLVAGIIVVFSGGFFAGQWNSPKAAEELISLRNIINTFTYNRTFSERPAENTNAAWKSLYPEFGTYFSHDTIIPHRSTLSVFHQLHCLDGIRHAYWQAYDAAIEGKHLYPSDIPAMSSPPHVRHCIDLLRQSLMCHLDRTIEVKDDAVGGVHGFDVQHQCKDWDALRNLLSQWQLEGLGK